MASVRLVRWLVPLLLVPVLAVACSGPDDPRAAPPPSSPGPGGQPTVPPLHPSVDGYPEAVVHLVPPEDDTPTVPLAVKVAATAEHRRHGLMEVPVLPDGVGMLFLYREDRDGAFWMKDTLVPLDIAFVRADGTVVAILAMEPCTADPCPRYGPGEPYRSALEVPQGWFDEVGVTAAWTLQLPDDLPAPA